MCRVGRLVAVVAVLACLGFSSTASAAPAFRDTLLSPSQFPVASGNRGVGRSDRRHERRDGHDLLLRRVSRRPRSREAVGRLHDEPRAWFRALERVDPSRAAGRSAAPMRWRGARLLQRAHADDLLAGRRPGDRRLGEGRAHARVRPPRRRSRGRTRRSQSVDYGTKRWASYENVCARKIAAGVLFPGAEDVAPYMLNPGEAFAETYRVLNEQKLGLPAGVMDDRDADALSRRYCAQPARAGCADAVDGAVAEGADGDADRQDPDAHLQGAHRTTGRSHPDARQAGRRKSAYRCSARSGTTVEDERFKRACGRFDLSSTVCGQRSYTRPREAHGHRHQDDEDDRHAVRSTPPSRARPSSGRAARGPRRSRRPVPQARISACRSRR